MKSPLLAFVFFCAGNPTFAAEYECPVQTKFDLPDLAYSEEQISRWQFSVRINDMGNTATISRCGFSTSAQSVTCDEYEVDYISRDAISGHTKFYNFRSQFDVQLFSNLSFVENNGRGSVAFGVCTLIRP